MTDYRAYDAALRGFESWVLRGRRPAGHAEEAETFLELLRDDLGLDAPSALRAQHLARVLLREYPELFDEFSDPDPEFILAAIRDLVRYLAEAGELASPEAGLLDTELTRLTPEFILALDAVTGGDEDDDEDEDFEDLDLDLDEDSGEDSGEDDEPGESLREAFGLPEVLPPVRLPAEAELAAMARGTEAIRLILEMARWLGPAGRAVAGGAVLDEDEDEAFEVTGITDPVAFYTLWNAGAEAGFIDISEDEEHAASGELAARWPDLSDAEALSAWVVIYAVAATDVLEIAAGEDDGPGAELDFTGQVPALLLTAYLAGGAGLPVAEAGEILAEGAVAGLPQARAARAWRSWVRENGDPVPPLLALLSGLGAVSVTAGEETGGSGGLLTLTPLGKYFARTELTEAGIEVPLLPPPGEMTAAELLAMAEAASEEEFAAERAGWLAGRDRETAARELFAAATGADPGARLLGFAVLGELGPAAESVLTEQLARDDLPPGIRAHIKTALISESTMTSLNPAELPVLEPGELAWLFTDVLVAEGWADPELTEDTEQERAELAATLAGSVPAGREAEVFQAMAGCGHPDAPEALAVIGALHPDKLIAKAARKAAYQAGTRRAARR